MNAGKPLWISEVKAFLLRSIFTTLGIGITFLMLYSCAGKPEPKQAVLTLHKPVIKFREADSQLTVYKIRDNEIPDSLSKLVCRNVIIESQEFSAYQQFFSKINPVAVTKIRIRQYDCGEVFSIDLKKFKHLTSLLIDGYDRLKEIRLNGNLDCHLKEVMLSSNVLKMPAFDKSFLTAKLFVYGGVSDTIPKWIEKLNDAVEFRFYSDHIHSIQCDVCKMNRIQAFDISQSDLYKSEEAYKSIHQQYNVLAGIVKCKPDIKFQYIPTAR